MYYTIYGNNLITFHQGTNMQVAIAHTRNFTNKIINVEDKIHTQISGFANVLYGKYCSMDDCNASITIIGKGYPSLCPTNCKSPL